MKKVLLYTLILFAYACSNSEDENVQLSAGLIDAEVDTFSLSVRQIEMMGISLTTPYERDLRPEIYANGVITSLPNSRASISVNIEAKVEKIFIREGMSVKRGQRLFSMSSLELLELEDQYVVARSEVELYKAEFERQAKLLENKVGSLADYQNARSKLQVANSSARSLRKKLEVLGINPDSIVSNSGEMTALFTVYSPIDGQVYKVNAILGSIVTDDVVLAEIVNTDQLQAEVYVFESNLTQVKEGQEVALDFTNHSLPTLKARITYITRVIDPSTRAFSLQVDFDKPKGVSILPDMHIRARITGKDSVFSPATVPITALIQEGESYYAFFAVEHKDRLIFRKRKVQVGRKDSQYAELLYLTGNPSLANNNLLLLDNEFKRLNIALSN